MPYLFFSDRCTFSNHFITPDGSCTYPKRPACDIKSSRYRLRAFVHVKCKRDLSYFDPDLIGDDKWAGFSISEISNLLRFYHISIQWAWLDDDGAQSWMVRLVWADRNARLTQITTVVHRKASGESTNVENLGSHIQESSPILMFDVNISWSSWHVTWWDVWTFAWMSRCNRVRNKEDGECRVI